MNFFTKYCKYLLATILIANTNLLANNILPNITITSMANGNWDSPTTWIGGVVPNAINCSAIVINNEVTVVANTSIACNLTVNVGAALIINTAINFDVIFEETTTLQTDAVTILGTFENKGNFYQYGKFAAGPNSFLKQTEATATFKMHASNGTAASSIPDGDALLTLDETANTEGFSKGLLQFFEPPFGHYSKTINTVDNGSGGVVFGPDNSDLDIRFGPTTTPNTANTDGFAIRFGNNFNCRNFVIDNGTGTGQIVGLYSFSNGTMFCDSNIVVQNGTLRASYEHSIVSGNFYARGITAGRNIINNGSIFCKNIAIARFASEDPVFTVPDSIGGTGIFTNSIIYPTQNTKNIFIYTNNPYGVKIGQNNFSCSEIALAKGKLFLNNNNIIFATTPYIIGNKNNYVVTNGSGKIIWHNDDVTSNIFQTQLHIGTATQYAPLWIMQDPTNPQAIDDITISVLPLTGANNIAQCFPAMWQISEATPGGNDGFSVEFEITDYPTATGFPYAIADVYNNTGSGWSKLTDNPYQFRYQANYANTLTYLSKNRIGISPNGLYAIAAGKGINPSGENIIASSGITENWSLNSTWQGGIKPTANDIVYIKDGDIVKVDETASCDGIQVNGKLNILDNNVLTSGTLGGGKSANYIFKDFNIGIGTFNLNGEITLKKETYFPTNTIGKITMSGGTINVDPNSGNIATSVTKTNGRFRSEIFSVGDGFVDLSGNINFKDPLFDADSTTLFCSAVNNQSTLPLNYTFGDGVTTNSSTGKFGGDISYVRAIDNVLINIGNENKSTMNYFNSNVYVNNFTVQSGTFKNQQSAASLNVSGNLTINTNLNSAVSFVGSSRQHVFGSGFFTENNNQNIVVQNQAGVEINMPNKIIWDDGINLLDGKIILNNTTIRYKVDQVGYPFDTASYFITNGTSKLETEITALANPTYYFPIGTRTGFSPIKIKPATSHVTDFITVSVADSVRVNGNSGIAYLQKVVHKSWNISEQTIGGSNVTITPQWNPENEGANFAYLSAYVSHYTTGVGWDLASGIDNAPFSVSRANITSFSPFAVTSSASILPITWLNFYATLNSTKNTNLSWKVQESADARYYWIEKSNDGTIFTNIGKVKSVGVGENIYSFIDPIALQKNAFYRIKEIDNGGKITYSKIVSLKINLQSLISVFVNENTLQIIANNSVLGKSFFIFDSKGSVIQKGILTQLQNVLYIPKLSSGVYFIKIENNEVVKFVKR